MSSVREVGQNESTSRLPEDAVWSAVPSEHPGRMRVNMGPQHPSTHGVLRLVLELDGETVIDCQPEIGYLHTGIEKTAEEKTYWQCVTLTDRIDYLSPLNMNMAYSLAVERLMDVEIPERARVIRVLLSELGRLGSHLVWLGTAAIDLGAQSAFLYCFREREVLLDLFEEISGARMMTSFIRPGGLQNDLTKPFLTKCDAFLRAMPAHIDEYESLLTRNELFKERTVGVGAISAERALALGVTGPSLRASGIDWDLRRDEPYADYDQYQFAVPTRTEGDVYARYLVRVAEMRESVKICRQAFDRIPPGPILTSDRKVALPPREEIERSMEALIHHFKLVTEGYKPPIGEVYQCIESPRGEFGVYLLSNGLGRPYRCHFRAPTFAALHALGPCSEGGLVADLVAIIGSLDPVMGEVDR
jgi:NADH-quinone oxidoreductase subunit D